MQRPPSVKGTIFQAVARELNEQLSLGTIRRDDLAESCKPGDLAYLDQEIAIASWYPIDTYGRYLRFLCDRFGAGSAEYLREGGRASARRVVAMGVYDQLDERTASWEPKVGRVLVTLGGSFYNFGRWEWKDLGANAFRIEVSDAAPMPEEAALRAFGFIEFLTERAAGRRVPVEYRRPRPSLVVFAFASHAD
jgi:hypothetical protein